MLLSIRRFSDQAQATDLALTRRLRRLSDTPWVLAGFAAVSRLGDGLVWYLLMLALLLLGDAEDQRVVLQMALLGIVSLLAYKALKRLSKRPRPLSRERALATAVAPLDEFSFPSGHTLHAVAFSIVVLATYGLLAWLLVPFTLAVALSRVVLGLHYPTDVAAGAAVGALLALSTLALL